MFENSSGSNVSWTSDTSFNGQWRHVALVAGSSTVELYLDGESQGSQSITPTLDFYHIGTGHTTENYDYDGRMDDFRYYNRTLIPTDIKDIYELKR